MSEPSQLTSNYLPSDPSIGTLKRAKTQPQSQSKDATTSTLNYRDRRATYHSNDGTQLSMDEEEGTFVSGTSTNISLDSGLGSKMSSTRSIDNVNSTELSSSRQLITNDSNSAAASHSSGSDTECKSEVVASATNVVQIMERNPKKAKNGHQDNDESKGSDSDLEDVKNDMMTEYGESPGHLTTIHESGAESTNEHIQSEDEGFEGSVDPKSKALPTSRDIHIEDQGGEKRKRRLSNVWNDVFGRCLCLHRPQSRKELDHESPEETYSPSNKPPTTLAVNGPDSGYDSVETKDLPTTQQPDITSNNSNLNTISTLPLTSNNFADEKAAVQELVQALQHFQNSQRMSDEALAGKSVQIDNFAATFLTNQGGRISLPKRNVNLYVPPGALPAGESPQLVYVYVLPPDPGNSLDDRDETWLTPSVHCGPSGLQFNKDVFVTMPHCASDIQQWAFTMHQVKRTKGDVWHPLENDDDGLLVVKQRDKVTMLMNHFCGQKGSGKSKMRSSKTSAAAANGKLMKVSVSSKQSLMASCDDKINIDITITNKDEVCRSLDH